MPSKEVARYVCDMADYHAKWSVSRKAGLILLSLPLIAVGLIVLVLAIVLG